MNINRNNYEEFFMLYADNELTAAERKTVEAFIAVNPDLQGELNSFQQFKLTPDDAIVFAGKESLLKQESTDGVITISNYESFFVLYADDELNNAEKAAVEEFVYKNPQLQDLFELILQAKLSPDASIVFENKESLYRKEEDDRVVPFRWWRMAAAAVVLLIAGILWMYVAEKRSNPADPIVKIKTTVTNPIAPSLNNKVEKKNTDTNSHEQPVKETIAITTDIRKEKQEIKNTQSAQVVPVKSRKQFNRDVAKTTDEPVIPKEEESVASNTLRGSKIASVKIEPEDNANINTGKAAAASKSVIDEQLVYNGTSREEKSIAVQAVATPTDNLEVLNTSVDTKNSLRGFFRKASRLVGKKNNLGNEDGKHKSILIGGFEIAVR